MIYRTRTIRRRTAAETSQLEQQILDVLGVSKQSVRHVFYRMTESSLPVFVEKSDDGYRQIQHLTMKLRRNGRLPYKSLTDSSRRGYFVDTYHSAADYLRSVAGLYRADVWQLAEYYVEVWAESRSIASVIQEDCRELCVSLYPAGGFSSVTFVYQAATDINETVDKPVEIFYIGDYDPAGVLIDVSIEKELRRHLRPDIQLKFRRLAINPDQIRKYKLPAKPRKKSDLRSRNVKQTVEAEAMPAEILRALLRDEIEALLPPRALEVAKVAERSEQESLKMFAKRMGSKRP